MEVGAARQPAIQLPDSSLQLRQHRAPERSIAMTLRAGAAEVVITPPVGTPLDGYGGRVGGAVAVHDDLHARALVLDDGATQAAIVSCELIGVDRRLVAAARERASTATGIPAAHIMIAATHTHAGPAGLRRELDEALTDVTARAIAGAIVAAHRELRPAVLKAGRGSVDSVSQNRRDPVGPADDALRVLLFDAPDPRNGAIAAIVSFACHSTVLFSTNMEISADYAGYAVRTARQIIGGPVLFLNGACGDVNPAWTEQRHDEAARVGSIVGAEAARRLQELRPLGQQQKVWNIRWDELTDKAVTSGELIAVPRIRVASRQVELPLRALDPPDVYARRIDELQRALGVSGGLAHEGEAPPAPAQTDERRRLMEQLTRYRPERGVAERLGPGAAGHTLRPELQAIALGDSCVVLGLPGECFVETARAIQDAAKLPHLVIACYANHYVGYIVPRHAFAEGGYEPGVTMLDETAEETMRAAAIDVLREVTAP